MKSSTYYFHMKTKILADSQICISVPLIMAKNIIPLSLPLQKWLCIKPGIQGRGTECGGWGECRQTFLGMSSQTFRGTLLDIPGNVAKYSGEYSQTSNIYENITKHSAECPKIFRGMLPNIPGNTAKHSREYPQTFRGMSVLIKAMRRQSQSKHRILHGI